MGTMLARKWYRPLLLGWMWPSLFIFILLSLLFHESLWVGLTVTWWLKPIWDRIPLMMASRALFGEEVSVKKTLRTLPAIAIKQWFAWLTWRRFSPTRAFDMPVTVLEGLNGAARHKRLNVLHLKAGGAATWLLIICAHLEFALAMGMLGIIYLFIPEEVNFNLLGFFSSEEASSEIIINVFTYIAMVLVAPFYTMAGFALYISRRIELEAWDIEVRFRHISSRRSKGKTTWNSPAADKTQGLGTASQALFIVVLLPALLLVSSVGQADADASEIQKTDLSAEAKIARDDIRKILKGKDFGGETTKASWRFKTSQEMEEDEEIPEWLIRLAELLEKLFSDSADDDTKSSGWNWMWVANALEGLLWVAAISLLIFLVVYYREYLRSFVSGMTLPNKPATGTPAVLFGLNIAEESLPDNIPGQVLVLWGKGASREALGLLYRATLSRLVYQYGFSFSASDTENECTETVRHSGMQELAQYLQGLTRTWQRFAYGHRMPSKLEVLDLCEAWPKIFHRES